MKKVEKSSLRTERLKSFKVQNSEIFKFIKRKPVLKCPEYKVPIINLSSHQLTDTEYRQLKFRLNQSFINKDKNVKTDIAIHIESLAYTVVKGDQTLNFQGVYHRSQWG